MNYVSKKKEADTNKCLYRQGGKCTLAKYKPRKLQCEQCDIYMRRFWLSLSEVGKRMVEAGPIHC